MLERASHHYKVPSWTSKYQSKMQQPMDATTTAVICVITAVICVITKVYSQPCVFSLFFEVVVSAGFCGWARGLIVR